MKREFTQEKYDYFCKLIDDINESQWCGISDWFGDRYLDVKHWLGSLGLNNYTENMDKYHREVLDRKNTAASQIRTIFENISSADDHYASASAGGIQQSLDTLDAYRKCLQQLTQIAVSGCNVVEAGGKLTDCFHPANIHNILGTAYGNLGNLLAQVDFNADSFHQLSDQYKKSYVELYDRLNPEEAAIIDKYLSDPDLTAAERNDIKFLIYNAPEPYRSIYIEHIRKYKVVVYNIGDKDAKYADGTNMEGTFYRGSDGKIYIIDSDKNFSQDSLGPYDTFFHESGHAIDDYENQKERTDYMLSREYVFEGKELNDWIVEDVRNHVKNYIDENYPNLSEDQKEALMRSLNLTDDASFDYKGQTDELDKKLIKYRDEIVKKLSDSLRGEENAPASDVIGGVTNNAIMGDYGHFDSNYNGGTSNYSYWYANGDYTNKHTSELWASFFAAKMTHDTESLESIREHFPQAYEAMEAMAQDMLKNR